MTAASQTVPTPSAADALPRAAYELARSFAAGATLWCVAPAWPEHGRHVAVEFVHPVIMGTRALAAVSVSGPDPVAAVRAVARPGDVIIVISATDDPVAAQVIRRAPAWGATTVWVASGPTTAEPSPDIAVHVDDPLGSAPYDGRLVLQYHLLWELTHVCFEHQGLLEDTEPADGEVCITCSDEGRLGEVVNAPPGAPDALVRTAAGMETVDVSLVGPLEVDHLVLVHAGSAIATVDAGPPAAFTVAASAMAASTAGSGP